MIASLCRFEIFTFLSKIFYSSNSNTKKSVNSSGNNTTGNSSNSKSSSGNNSIEKMVKVINVIRSIHPYRFSSVLRRVYSLPLCTIDVGESVGLSNTYFITTVNNNDASSSSSSASNYAESFDLRMKSMEDQINNLSLAFTRFMKEPMFSSNTNSNSQRTHDDSDTENEQSDDESSNNVDVPTDYQLSDTLLGQYKHMVNNQGILVEEECILKKDAISELNKVFNFPYNFQVNVAPFGTPEGITVSSLSRVRRNIIAKEIYGSEVLLPIKIKDTPKMFDETETERVRKLAKSIRKNNEAKQSLLILNYHSKSNAKKSVNSSGNNTAGNSSNSKSSSGNNSIENVVKSSRNTCAVNGWSDTGPISSVRTTLETMPQEESELDWRAYSRILQYESQIIVQSNQELQLATEEGSVQSNPTSVRSNPTSVRSDPDGSVRISPEPSNEQLLNNQNE
ncbi:hypothetical protein ACTFIW_003791 [Dictyostelium discoideum]